MTKRVFGSSDSAPRHKQIRGRLAVGLSAVSAASRSLHPRVNHRLPDQQVRLCFDHRELKLRIGQQTPTALFLFHLYLKITTFKHKMLTADV